MPAASAAAGAHEQVVSDSPFPRTRNEPQLEPSRQSDRSMAKKPLKKRRVCLRHCSVESVGLMRQVASCWLDHPHKAQRKSSGTLSWATVVATSPPSSGPYLYDERYCDEHNKGTALEDSPKVEELKAMSSAPKHPTGVTRTAGSGNAEDDTELEVESLTNSKSQFCMKEAWRKEGAAAPVTPSPFLHFLERSGKSPPVVHKREPKAKPERAWTSEVKPPHLPDFVGAPLSVNAGATLSSIHADGTGTTESEVKETRFAVGSRVDYEDPNGNAQLAIHPYDPKSFATKMYGTPDIGHSAFSTSARCASGSRSVPPLADCRVLPPYLQSNFVLPNGTTLEQVRVNSSDLMKSKKRMTPSHEPYSLDFLPAYSPLARVTKKRVTAPAGLPLDIARAINLSSGRPQDASMLHSLQLEEQATRVSPSRFLSTPHHASPLFMNTFGLTESSLKRPPEAPVSPRDVPLKKYD